MVKKKKAGFFKDLPEWWEKHWQGMPEFIQEDQQPLKSILVHFQTKEDIEEFAELINQKITPKTRFLWYPKAKINPYANKRYIDKENKK